MVLMWRMKKLRLRGEATPVCTLLVYAPLIISLSLPVMPSPTPPPPEELTQAEEIRSWDIFHLLDRNKTAIIDTNELAGIAQVASSTEALTLCSNLTLIPTLP